MDFYVYFLASHAYVKYKDIVWMINIKVSVMVISVVGMEKENEFNEKDYVHGFKSEMVNFLTIIFHASLHVWIFYNKILKENMKISWIFITENGVTFPWRIYIYTYSERI